MTYIYDILLNFNRDFFEFYDWNKNDKIIHIKKIPIYRVDNKVIKDVLYNKVVFNKNFLNLIKDKTEVFYKHEIGKIKYSCLIYSNEKIIALNVDLDGNIIGLSDLLIDEYTEIFESLSDSKYIKPEYEIKGKIDFDDFKTRNDRVKEKLILKSLNKMSNEQLQYIYYETFLKNEVDRVEILSKLYKNKDNETLYNLIKCILDKYKKIK